MKQYTRYDIAPTCINAISALQVGQHWAVANRHTPPCLLLGPTSINSAHVAVMAVKMSSVKDAALTVQPLHQLQALVGAVCTSQGSQEQALPAEGFWGVQI